MRQILLKAAFCGVLIAGAAPGVFAQGDAPANGAQGQATKETAEQQGEMKWKVINTAIFAVLLGYLIAKSAPAFFNARSADIQRAIKEATGLKMDADLRYSEADRKMATLADEVKRLRAEAAAEMEREHQRMRDETSHERARIQQSLENEKEALQQEAIARVRWRTASAALDLAQQQLRGRGAEHENNLLHDFVEIVGGAK